MYIMIIIPWIIHSIIFKKYPSFGNLALKPSKSQNKCVCITQKNHIFKQYLRSRRLKSAIGRSMEASSWLWCHLFRTIFHFLLFVFCTTQLLFVDCTLLQQGYYALGDGLIDAQPLLMSLARSSETRLFSVELHFMRKWKFWWIWCITGYSRETPKIKGSRFTLLNNNE